jgi:hypothetical protein
MSTTTRIRSALEAGGPRLNIGLLKRFIRLVDAGEGRRRLIEAGTLLGAIPPAAIADLARHDAKGLNRFRNAAV